MTAVPFRFHLFDSSLKSVLSNCNYINLPFAIPNVHQEINYLLTKCGELYFQEIEDSGLLCLTIFIVIICYIYICVCANECSDLNKVLTLMNFVL